MGYEIVNSYCWLYYYVLGRGWSDEHALENMYILGEPGFVAGDHIPVGSQPAIRGAKLHVWCDRPDSETEEQVQDSLTIALRNLAQQNWHSDKPTTDYQEWLAMGDAIGRCPGFAGGAAVSVSRQTHKAVVAPRTQPVLYFDPMGRFLSQEAARHHMRRSGVSSGCYIQTDGRDTRIRVLR